VISKSFAAAALAAILLGAAHRLAPLVVYSAPAGDRPAGADRLRPTDAILPNGRIAAPAGRSVLVGTNPLGLALSPDGRYAIVSNDSQQTGGLAVPISSPPLVVGYSLAVVDTRTMRLTDVYQDPAATFFLGIAAVRDPNDPARTLVLASDGGNGLLRVFQLTAAGQLVPQPPIAMPAQGVFHAFPAGLSVSPDGRTAYVADNLGDTVTAIDLVSRSVLRTVPVGDFPFYVAASARHVLVTAMGLSSYAPLTTPEREPAFAPPAFDPSRSSTLAVLGTAPGGSIAGDPAIVRMDPQPDGALEIGGAAPGAVIVNRDGRVAYVCLPGVDRVAVVRMDGGDARVVRGLDLRLYPQAPYGAQPSAEVLSKDGKRLYVALAGLDAVAVLAARSPERYRYGLIPTGWYPIGLALGPNGRYLYVLNAKGVDGWGLLQKIDLKKTKLVTATLDALRYDRTPHKAGFDAVIPALRSGRRSAVIDHVVYISAGTQTYDEALGDLKSASGEPRGDGDAALTLFPRSVTPNLHALAATYALADNFFADDENLAIARQFALSDTATIYTTLVADVSSARLPLDGRGDDPESYPRSGYVFNAVARAGLSYRDYGGLLRLSGYGSGLYRLNVPALAALEGNTDLNYPGPGTSASNLQRAREFVADMQRYVEAGSEPSFTYVWLPAEPGARGAADADRALGTIVAYLSRTPQWSSTAIFLVPDGVQPGGVDHVNDLRTYALVISPLAKRGYVGREHLSVSSVVKTEEEILGLPPLGLNDLLATDMADFFTDAPDPQPYDVIER
jgi:YVTN family beta-propeller protein